MEDLPLYEADVSSLNWKRKFRFFSFKTQNNHNEAIHLCYECYNHFSENNTRSTKLRYDPLWPSFVWSLLSNEKIQSIYGIKFWQLLCPKIRRWWLHSVTECIPFYYKNKVSLEEPQSIFIDNTCERNIFLEKSKVINLGI